MTHRYTREEMRPVIPAVLFMIAIVLGLIPNDLRIITDPRVLMAIVAARVLAAVLLGAVLVAAITRSGGAWYEAMLRVTYLVLVFLDISVEITRPTVTYYSALPSFLFIAVAYFVIPARLPTKAICTGLASIGRMYWMFSSSAIAINGAWTILISYLGLHVAGISHELIMQRFRLVDAAYRKRLADDVRFKHALADSAWEGIILVDNGVVVDVNQRVIEMLGVGEAELVGREASAVYLIDPSDEIRFRAEDAVVGQLVAGDQSMPARLAKRIIVVDGSEYEAIVVEDISREVIRAYSRPHPPETGPTGQLERVPITTRVQALFGSALTRREIEIAAALADGLSRMEIAERFFIADETVKRHTANLYRKLGVHSRVELAKLLFQSSSLEDDSSAQPAAQ